MSLPKFLIAGLFATVFTASAVQAAVVVRFNDEVLNMAGTGGTVAVTLESNTPPQTAGSYDFDLLFSNFTGNLVGQQVNITGYTFNTGVAQVTTPSTGLFSDGGTTALSGAFLPAVTLNPSSPFLTISFTVPSALNLGDTFTVGLQPMGQIVGDANSFADIYGGVSPQVVGTATAVPEPGTFAFCGLVIAGLAHRRRMKSKVA